MVHAYLVQVLHLKYLALLAFHILFIMVAALVAMLLQHLMNVVLAQDFPTSTEAVFFVQLSQLVLNA